MTSLKVGTEVVTEVATVPRPEPLPATARQGRLHRAGYLEGFRLRVARRRGATVVLARLAHLRASARRRASVRQVELPAPLARLRATVRRAELWAHLRASARRVELPAYLALPARLRATVLRVELPAPPALPARRQAMVLRVELLAHRRPLPVPEARRRPSRAELKAVEALAMIQHEKHASERRVLLCFGCRRAADQARTSRITLPWTSVRRRSTPLCRNDSL